MRLLSTELQIIVGGQAERRRTALKGLERSGKRMSENTATTDNSETYRKMVDDPRIREECNKDRSLCRTISVIQIDEDEERISYLPSQSWWQKRLKGWQWDLEHILGVTESYAVTIWEGEDALVEQEASTPEQAYVKAYMWGKYGEKWDGERWGKR